MISTVYVEREVRDHERAREILARFPRAVVVPIERFGEVFNRRNQSFRLQKRSPSLILARKFHGHVLETPPGYGLGGFRNYYFSHMLNCVYDCRYCFLQGMFRSAHYVVFVNYEDFEGEIDRRIAAPGKPAFFYSGYDCDSLALEGLTSFADRFLGFFARRPQSWLELRTKSVAIDALRARSALPNCVVAFSLSPRQVASALEHGAPDLDSRLRAAAELADRGWRLGLRFDPLIHHRGFRQHYRSLFREVFARLPVAALHSVSLGAFRMPSAYYRNLVRQRPDEPLLAVGLEERAGSVTYDRERLAQLRGFCETELLSWIPPGLYQPCMSGEEAAA